MVHAAMTAAPKPSELPALAEALAHQESRAAIVTEIVERFRAMRRDGTGGA